MKQLNPQKSRAQQNPSAEGQTSLHFGNVVEVNEAQYKVKVEIKELGMNTYWLRTGPLLPARGCQVACFLQNEGSGGWAFVAGNGPILRMRMQFEDGTYMYYENRELMVAGRPQHIQLETDRIDFNLENTGE